MRVSELIAALREMPQHATVFVEDASAQPGPGVHRLGCGEVSQLEVGAWESAGMCLYELWRDDGSMSGPYPGVLLGSLQCNPAPSIADLVARMSDDELRALIAEAQRAVGQ